MGFIDAIPGAASTQASRDMTPSVDCRQARQTGGDDSTHAVLNRPASGPQRRLSRGRREEDGGQCDSDLCVETPQLIEMRRLEDRGWRQLREPQVKQAAGWEHKAVARDLRSSPKEAVGFRFPGETRNRQKKRSDKRVATRREGGWKEVERGR